MLNELKELSGELKALLETGDELTKNLYAYGNTDRGGAAAIVGVEELKHIQKATASVARNIDETIERLQRQIREVAGELESVERSLD